MTKETVGKIATDLMKKEAPTLDAVELQREMQTDYEKNVEECIESGKKDWPGNFYIVVITKKERLLENVLRNFFFSRQTCPTPDYDQTVYHYVRSAGVIEYMWTLPAKNVCEYMRDNHHLIPPDEYGLLKHVTDFYDGTLLRKSKDLSHEASDSNIIIKK